jgi:hypothetical protein
MSENQELVDKILLGRHSILKYFKYDHLPIHLQEISAPISAMAFKMAATLPANAELSAGLRKLLEAKDCFVRAQIG